MGDAFLKALGADPSQICIRQPDSRDDRSWVVPVPDNDDKQQNWKNLTDYQQNPTEPMLTGSRDTSHTTQDRRLAASQDSWKVPTLWAGLSAVALIGGYFLFRCLRSRKPRKMVGLLPSYEDELTTYMQ